MPGPPKRSTFARWRWYFRGRLFQNAGSLSLLEVHEDWIAWRGAARQRSPVKTAPGLASLSLMRLIRPAERL